jgi:hypothetical protein
MKVHKFLLGIVSPMLLLLLASASLATEPGHERSAGQPEPNQQNVSAGPSQQPGEPHRSQQLIESEFKKAGENYRRLLQERDLALSEAESLEERTEINRRFLKESQAFRAVLEKKKMVSHNRLQAQEKQRLDTSFAAKRRRLEQNYAIKLRHIEKERSSLLSGLYDKNWPTRVGALEQRERSLRQEHQRQLRLLEKSYQKNLLALE